MDNKNHSGKEWIIINMEERSIKKQSLTRRLQK